MIRDVYDKPGKIEKALSGVISLDDLKQILTKKVEVNMAKRVREEIMVEMAKRVREEVRVEMKTQIR